MIRIEYICLNYEIEHELCESRDDLDRLLKLDEIYSIFIDKVLK